MLIPLGVDLLGVPTALVFVSIQGNQGLFPSTSNPETSAQLCSPCAGDPSLQVLLDWDCWIFNNSGKSPRLCPLALSPKQILAGDFQTGPLPGSLWLEGSAESLQEIPVFPGGFGTQVPGIIMGMIFNAKWDREGC